MTTLLRPYCTLLEVGKETKNSAPENDDWYRACINMASRWVEEYCHRDFWFHDHSETPYVVPRKYVLGDEVFLPFPIISLDSLVIDDKAWDVSTDIYLEDSRIVSEETEFGDYPFRGKMEITGTFGYPLAEENSETTPPPTIPSSVRRACIIVAAAISAEKHVEQVGLDGVRVELLDMRIPNEAKNLLSRFVVRFGHTL